MNIWILPIEPVETRYTGQWHKNIPEQLKLLAGKNVDVISVDGEIDNRSTTPGAFLNFASTNIWKSSQMAKIAEYFSNGTIGDGDQFLVTDAWNPAILQLKYMIVLLGHKNSKIHGIWHAGQYDSYDFLGRCLPNKKWAKHTEQALFNAIDHNYFATKFHLNLFIENVFDGYKDKFENFHLKKIVLCGQPHELMVKHISIYGKNKKQDKIIFPHRVAPEKQPEMFRDLSTEMSEYEFVVCQDHKLSKEEYHIHLANSKIMLSFSMQETLGIGAMEAILVDCIPLVPDRLSYSEMYLDFFKYPSNWTNTWDNFIKNKENIKNLVIEKISNYNSTETKQKLAEQKEILLNKYLNSNIMYQLIISNLNKGKCYESS